MQMQKRGPIIRLLGRNPTELRLIFALDVIYQSHDNRPESWNLFFCNHDIYRDVQMQ